MSARAVRLYRKHTVAELVALQEAITSDPASRNTKQNSIYLYEPKARKKLNDIARAITYHLKDTREDEGSPVSTEGYSGRQSKRR